MSRTPVLFASLVLTAASAVAAPLSFVLDQSLQAALPGQSVIFQGTLKNLAAPDLFLNDYQLTFLAPAGTYLADDHNYFFFNVPGVLLAGETYTGPILRVTLAPNTPGALFVGSIMIEGGDTPDALDLIGTRSFQVTIAPEPETASLLLVSLAVTLVASRPRRTPTLASRNVCKIPMTMPGIGRHTSNP